MNKDGQLEAVKVMYYEDSGCSTNGNVLLFTHLFSDNGGCFYTYSQTSTQIIWVLVSNLSLI